MSNIDDLVFSMSGVAHLISDTKRALSAHLFVHGLEVAGGKHHLPQPALLGTCSGPAPVLFLQCPAWGWPCIRVRPEE